MGLTSTSTASSRRWPPATSFAYRPIRRRHARCNSSPLICSRPCWLHHALRRNRSRIRLDDKTSPVPGLGYLLPNKHVRQCAVDASQQRITDAGKAAEQAQIEPAFAAVPTVIAGRGGGLQNRGQPLLRKRAKIVAAQRRAGLAEEFYTAQRAAAQCIDGSGPAKP